MPTSTREPVQSPFEPLQKAVVARLNLHPASQAIPVFDTEPAAGEEEPAVGDPFIVVELLTSDPSYTDDGVLYEATVRLVAHYLQRGGPGSPAALMQALRQAEEALTSRPLAVEGYGQQELEHDSAQKLPADGAEGRTRRRAVLDFRFDHYATR
jgi:hypothetical protein